MYTEVDLAVPRASPPMVIPADTLVVRGDGPQVAVVDPDGMVHFKLIHLGRDLGDHHRGAGRPRSGSDAGRQSRRHRARRRPGETASASEKAAPKR
jgi:hypothetical protein